jgi:hypothetical protein
VIVAKYGWHLPLYRQAKMLAIQGARQRVRALGRNLRLAACERRGDGACENVILELKAARQHPEYRASRRSIRSRFR